MIKNYLLITLRSMMKSKVYLFINIFGMAISIGCCITAYYNWDFNNSFDTVHENASQIYRINSIRKFQDANIEYGISPAPLAEIARANAKDITHITRYLTNYADMRIGDEIFDNVLSFVDPDMFHMFTFQFLHGDPMSIKDKSKIIISDENAIRLFGTVDAVGKTMTMIRNGAPSKEYEVGAVFKLPPINSSFNDGSFVLYDNYFDIDEEAQKGTNWKYRSNTFVMVPDANRIPTIEAQLKPFTENNNKVREDFIMTSFHLDPLVGMAKRDEYDNRNGTWTRDATPRAAVMGCAIMGIFILLIACFNLTNTSIAMSSRRLKEIGIRKVMGSRRKQLVIQFIGETMIVCFLALLIGMLIADLFLIPAFNALWPDMKLQADYLGKPEFMIVMVGVLLFTSLLAGAYPALYITKFQPTTILKGQQKFGGASWLSKTLLGVQFAISLMAIVCSLAFIDNAKFQHDFDMGFNRNGAMYTWVNSEDEYNALKNVMSQNPDVTSISGSEHQIQSNFYRRPVKNAGKEVEVDIIHVGADYLPTMGLTLTQGRNFKENSETDSRESIIITNKLATLFGLNDPIGAEIVLADTMKFYVVGVVKDIYNRGLWRDFEPIMIRYSAPDKYRHLNISASQDKLASVNKYMEDHWKEVFPNRKFASRYMDDELRDATEVNVNIVKMFVFLGIVALLLSATGLFTLVSLNIIKKMKEIGVRKVLGASIANISRVINTQFVIILLVSCLVGGWLGAFMAEMLMDSIWDFFKKTTVTTMVISSVIMLVAAALSVSFKTYNTAKMNPVHVLRDE
ncbi:MAG TPA: ABC transporter permease [Cyclobacteriaceae bacterium]|nr:ABC transporter permease [Cyclobacteriaceae bacterium]